MAFPSCGSLFNLASIVNRLRVKDLKSRGRRGRAAIVRAGESLYSIDSLEAGARVAREAIARGLGTYAPWFALAWSYAHRDMPHEAMDAWRRARTLNPSMAAPGLPEVQLRLFLEDYVDADRLLVADDRSEGGFETGEHHARRKEERHVPGPVLRHAPRPAAAVGESDRQAVTRGQRRIRGEDEELQPVVRLGRIAVQRPADVRPGVAAGDRDLPEGFVEAIPDFLPFVRSLLTDSKNVYRTEIILRVCYERTRLLRSKVRSAGRNHERR